MLVYEQRCDSCINTLLLNLFLCIFLECLEEMIQNTQRGKSIVRLLLSYRYSRHHDVTSVESYVGVKLNFDPVEH